MRPSFTIILSVTSPICAGLSSLTGRASGRVTLLSCRQTAKYLPDGSLKICGLGACMLAKGCCVCLGHLF